MVSKEAAELFIDTLMHTSRNGIFILRSGAPRLTDSDGNCIFSPLSLGF